ncbi:hypothetical protein SEA_BILLNYE_168 [Streptomyces phage BillNye]|uniref:Uncharacterized protein n=1 Tax=Streptomyces phage BillNye TaxID=2079426 RepID=A0A2L1IVW0_9CAUD|nr:hypothetical protein FDJ30_gp093 [Streptomyces phage BillNye]AVD99340.1 hypothetical protein SEA_BILLNYE_168 [Streptomyces phage BillNye]
MDLEQIIDWYNDLREKCLEVAKKKPELFGDSVWLQYAIQESDITLYFIAGVGVECSGMAYTSQTMDNEPFDFIIPFSELED